MKKEDYSKPELVKHGNLKKITFSTANWSYSVICNDGRNGYDGHYGDHHSGDNHWHH